MAKGRQLKGRIRSVQNTRKITRTMELVSTSKLKRAQDRVVAARPYAEALREVLADPVTPDLSERFPLLRRPASPAKGGPSQAAVILLTSNRGLAGAFNSNLIKEARRRVEELERAGYTVELHGIGKKGIGFFKYLRRKLALERIDIGDKPTADHAAEIAEPLIAAYSSGTLASVDLVHARFVSALTTPPTTGPNARLEPNDVAEYLDNVLPSERIGEVEQIALESDVHLAEVAATHQILTLVLGEPALVPPTARQRFYGIAEGKGATAVRKPARPLHGSGPVPLGGRPLHDEIAQACADPLAQDRIAVERARVRPCGFVHHSLRSSRSFRNTVFASGCSGRSGNRSRRFAISVGLPRRRNVLCRFSSASVVTTERAGSWPVTLGSSAFAASLSGSRASVNFRLFSM